jgi:serine protease
VSAGAALLYSLGLNSPAQMQSGLLASISKFRSRSASYAKKKIKIGGHYYYFNLNCSGHAWCGAGVLDLSKAQVQLAAPTIAGASSPIVGEPLVAQPGAWVMKPKSVRYVWKNLTGDVIGSGNTYYPTLQDVGTTLTVTVGSNDPAFESLTSTSSATAPVPAGPAVTMTGTGDSPLPFGPPYITHVTVTDPNGGVVEDGTVKIRRPDGTVIATGVTQAVEGSPSTGVVDIAIPGAALPPDTHLLRAAYVGQGATPAASSPRTRVQMLKRGSKVDIFLPKTVSHNAKAKLKIRVTIPFVTNPTGTIRIYGPYHGWLTTTMKASDHGVKTYYLPKMTKGGHRYKVDYMGGPYGLRKRSTILLIRAY